MLMGFVLGAYAYNNYGKVDQSVSFTDDGGVLNKFVYNITSVLYCMTFTVMLSISPAVSHLHTHTRILKNEIIAGYVRETSCWISMLIINIPIYICAVMSMGIIIWYMLKLEGDVSNYYGVLILGILGAYSLATVCAVWCCTGYTANRVYVFICGVMMGVSGYLRYV